MQACPTCGKQLEANVRFCPEDGTPLTQTAAATIPHTPTGSPASSARLALPVLLNNRYRLVQCLGGGGMAHVYRAVDTVLEREVAVKLINPELRADPEFDARFQREARIASQLADPHIVVVHDFGIDVAQGPYLVMEYLQGETLRQHLQTKGPLPVRPGLQLSAQLLLALIHAHEKGIIHRDLKPDNVFLLNQSGVRLCVRVLDFGIARIYRRDDPSPHETLTRPGAVLGTPRYMSPEQLAGQPLDVRSDLYSAALVIYEGLTGTLPYVSQKQLCELCPELPGAVQEVLLQCLQQNPADRPPSAVDVYLQLQGPCKASGVLLLPPGAMDKLALSGNTDATVTYVAKEWKPLRRRVFLGLGAAAALGAVTWGLVAFFGSASKSTAEKESLQGLEVGSNLVDVALALGKPEGRTTGDPWQNRPYEMALGHLLRPADLGLPETELEELELLQWHGYEVCVLLRQETLRAMIIREPYRGQNGRGIHIGDHEARLVDRYSADVAQEESFPLSPAPATTEGQPAKRGKIYRYAALGISFEVQHKRITAIALYPPKP